jgi:hypothetical protein
MDKDPCATNVFWSTISAASADSTLAGLLAGLLIAAAAALIVQTWYQGSDSHTIALFSSGVPALALSTYLFTVIAGVHFPEETDPKGLLCSQLWSQWLLAFGLVFIGTAILVCGLGWALISYGENLAVTLCQRNFPIETVEDRRKFFIRLNGWLSGAIVTAGTAFLIVSNVLYLKAIGDQNLNLLFFVYLFGLYSISRSSYVVISRTTSAMRANKRSCAAYAADGPPVATEPAAKDPRFARRKKLAMRAAQEFGVVMWVAACALLAVYMTSYAAGQWSLDVARGKIAIYVVVLYIIVRAAYVLIVGIAELVSAKKDDTPANNAAVPPADAESVERIRIKYSFGRLSATT